MTGAIVQRMSAAGTETIVGSTQDPLFGPLVLFGMGGVTAELLADHALRIVPLTDEDAREQVRSLRGSPLLFGYRGASAVDVAALEDVLLRVGRLADELPEVAEMDLNPVHRKRARCRRGRREGPHRGRRRPPPTCVPPHEGVAALDGNPSRGRRRGSTMMSGCTRRIGSHATGRCGSK